MVQKKLMIEECEALKQISFSRKTESRKSFRFESKMPIEAWSDRLSHWYHSNHTVMNWAVFELSFVSVPLGRATMD
jgi:hypothetical protein